MGRRRSAWTETYPTVEDAALALHSAEELKVLAKFAGIRPVPSRKADLARAIARHPKTRRHCLRAGERHLAVPDALGVGFRRGLRAIGYALR